MATGWSWATKLQQGDILSNSSSGRVSSSSGEDRGAQPRATAIPRRWVSCLCPGWHCGAGGCHSARLGSPGSGRRPGPRPSVHALSPPRGRGSGLRNLPLLLAPTGSGNVRRGYCGRQTFPGSPNPGDQGSSSDCPNSQVRNQTPVCSPNTQASERIAGNSQPVKLSSKTVPVPRRALICWPILLPCL